MNQPPFPKKNELFRDFTDREKQMRAVTRYSIRKVMFYRSDIYSHSSHTAWIVHSLTPNLKQALNGSIDIDKAVLMALVHDDLEIITGDVQSVHKDAMNSLQKEHFLQAEEKALKKLAVRFPENIGEYNYEAILNEFQTLNTLESHIVKLADILDAFGETLHEVYAGNQTFTEQIIDNYGTHLSPFDFYTNKINSFTKKFPDTVRLLKTSSPFFMPLPKIDFKQIVKNGKPHTNESIKAAVGHPLYDEWKRVIIEYANKSELAELYSQKEP